MVSSGSTSTARSTAKKQLCRGCRKWRELYKEVCHACHEFTEEELEELIAEQMKKLPKWWDRATPKDERRSPTPGIRVIKVPTRTQRWLRLDDQGSL